MLRVFLTLLLILFAFWMATSAVVPPPGVAPEEEATAIWRRTDQGWQRAESWLKPSDHLRREPVPPLYPVALLPLIVVLGVLGLILGQPKKAPEEVTHAAPRPHLVKGRSRPAHAGRK